MRIIAGKHKGRRILSSDKGATRPTTSRVREALFSILSSGQFIEDETPFLEDAVVADVCCGTGALGLEALSRGAKHSIFIDQSSRQIQLVEQNIEHFGEQSQTTIFRADATALPMAPAPCDLVLMDPPYKTGLGKRILAQLVKKQWLRDGSIIVWEMHSREDAEFPEGFTQIDERRYSASQLVLLMWNPPAQEASDNDS